MSHTLQGASVIVLALASAALAQAATPALVKTTTTVPYLINSRFYSKAATDNLPFTIEPNSGIVPTAPNSFRNLAANESCTFGVFIDAAGAITFAQGDIVSPGSKAPVPQPPAGKVLIGALKINATASTATAYTPGVTSLATIGTYVNLAAHPGEGI